MAPASQDEHSVALSWRPIRPAEELVPSETPETLKRGVPACCRAKQTRCRWRRQRRGDTDEGRKFRNTFIKTCQQGPQRTLFNVTDSSHSVASHMLAPPQGPSFQHTWKYLEVQKFSPVQLEGSENSFSLPEVSVLGCKSKFK